MPVAAVPAYLAKGLLRDASPGLRFGMYLKLWGINNRSGELLWETYDVRYERRGPDQREREVRSENKRDALDEACKLTASDARTMQALVQRQRILADWLIASGDLVRLEAAAVAPFATGLGNEHPLENGFAFLSPYGLPYLPGSGVKGVVRQAARELASGDWGDRNGWMLDPCCRLEIGGKPIELSPLDVLFGRETPSGERQHLRGALSFWDVIPQIEGRQLLVEVMTPHQAHYYQDGEAPHESGSPNPINFLSVPPKSRFTFHVRCDRAHLRRAAPAVLEEGRWKGLAEAAFAHAFQWLGFGAKTSVGYGALTPPTAPLDRGGPPVAPGSTTEPRVPRTEAQGETWNRARLQYNPRNGTLTAVGPDNAKAHAYGGQAAELLARLPDEVQRKVRSGSFGVQVVARVLGPDLIALGVQP